ncbi:MAG: hypothetical protein ABJF88_16495 [Rhodothermales bacterium]
MSIQPLRSGTARLDPKASDAAGEARPTPPVAKTSDAGSAAQDRIELSDAARARTNEPQDPALESARETLRSLPGLDPERKAIILGKLEENAYGQPDTIKRLAERLRSDLNGQPPTE